MDKNTIIGFLLIAGLLFGYSALNKPSEEELKQAEISNREAAEREQARLEESAKFEENKLAQQSSSDTTSVNNRLKDMYGVFAPAAVGGEDTISIENEVVALKFSTKGGILSEARVKGYQTYDSLPLILFNNESDSYGFIFKTMGRIVDSNDLFFSAINVSDSTVTMRANTEYGGKFDIIYTLAKDSYLLDVQIKQDSMYMVLPKNTATLDIYWNQRIRSQEKGRMFEEKNSGIYYKFIGSDVEKLSESDDDKETVAMGIKWIGFKNQFFSSALIADGKFNGAEMQSVVIKDNDKYLKDVSMKSSVDYNPNVADGPSFKFFLGPNLYPLLKSYDDNFESNNDKWELDNLVPLGWSLFRWINTVLIIPVFTFLGAHLANYGLIIFILTILIKIVLAPLTYKSYMSTAKIRVLKPQIDEINAKYPGNDKALERQRATMDLYSKAGANPMSGCLPMLLQMPILIAMFAFFPSSIELRGESFLWATDLSSYDSIYSWDTYIPFITPYFGNHISLFCLLMTVTNILYTKINMENTATGPQMPGMKAMMYMMPLMFLVFFNNYAAGLSYYYFVSLLITILQTYAFRKFINEEKVLAKLKANQKKPRKKSGWAAKLEEAQKRQEAIMRERRKEQQKKGRK